MFWLRQLIIFFGVYFLLSFGAGTFNIFFIDNVTFFFHLLMICALIGLSFCTYGKKIIEQVYNVTFLNLKSVNVDKPFILNCAKTYYARGALSLDPLIKKTSDLFVHKAINLLVEQVTVHQFESELNLEIEYFNRRLMQAKVMLLNLMLNYFLINVMYSLILLVVDQGSGILISTWLCFLSIITLVFFPVYFQVSLYQKKKIDIYLVYLLGFKGLLNQMSTRQIENSISNACEH